MARDLKFQMWEVKVLYPPWSENKGTDQLGSYHAADLHLVFADAKCRFSHDAAHIYMSYKMNKLGLPDFTRWPEQPRTVGDRLANEIQRCQMSLNEGDSASPWQAHTIWLHTASTKIGKGSVCQIPWINYHRWLGLGSTHFRNFS